MKTTCIIGFLLLSLNSVAVLSQSEYSVRLEGSPDRNRGTVEIYLRSRTTYQFKWGTLCDYYWGINDAHVVCRQLGYSHATAARRNSYYGRGTTNTIWVTQFHCDGSESSMSECPSNSGDIFSTSCDGSDDAGVDCYVDYCLSNPCRNGGTCVLQSNGFYCQCRNSFRGSLCQTFDYCLSDPCQNGGTCVIQSNGFECRCRDSFRGTFCQIGRYPVRLRGSSDGNRGRVELYFDERWGTICGYLWDINDANVACRQLGYSHATVAHYTAYYGQGSGTIWMNVFNCDGSESSLSSCQIILRSHFDCDHSADAGVDCYVEMNSGTDRSAGSIAGIVIGVIIFLSVICCCYSCCCKDSNTVEPTRVTQEPTVATISYRQTRIVTY